MSRVVLASFFLLTAAPAHWALADNADTANKSNNPLNLAPGVNLQDYYTPRVYDSNVHTNDLLLRGTLPMAPGELIPVPQLLRATLPVSTRPDPHGGYSTGIGDLNLFDIFLLKTEGVQLGIGPQITAPTAARDELGTGKWQAGLAAVAIDASPRGLLGALVQYQSSFAGDSDRQRVETATFQPFLIHNLPRGWYLRSTGTWTFDLKNDTHYIPIGFGVGKASKVGHNIYNWFVEPQWTVARRGDDLPQFTLFAGINVTLGK
ncbi:hypothetical protein [Pseudomonas gingeri]|uniref:Neuromedin U n=1 Tax=Pseudomonas gingeri TaxID=117681 RepID=A0A7Y7YGS1_9PSED|nr:hypothetical protein [Pseudomonas gingeri]NWB27952.1 hypothetical protein [Pseudomonas gingeri]NWC35476.1 hypothetical protein [Pseudomonas gingeri]NWD04578.1 hypothetical protein [Pseudomonas gingeri]NWD51434.1 hypothetical protein [Pseudomonas gingeri]NWE31056.1 hypothetical protein [Pseudomonas gingeri]